ncbi:MAG TPA: MOSC domain-containing protein [Thermoanaerobaculia bacterium]|jgi:MOSC domain-containing protein YiiM|nr:MOSC domain-containing protein [Thermoanaerobaculia bacterium]
MKIVSVNVGLPRPVEWRGRRIMTGIFKEPISGSVAVRRLNLDGDRQADLSVHGGVHKAVYAYPSEHYPFWRQELNRSDLPWGAFGENLTTEGWWEDEIHIGDRFRAGTAEFIVTQPRTPCFKLALKFDLDDIIDEFLQTARPGFYLAVAKEGELAVGDAFERIHEDERHVTVTDIVHLYADRHARPNPDLLRRVVEVEALPAAWREHFRKRLG